MADERQQPEGEDTEQGEEIESLRPVGQPDDRVGAPQAQSDVHHGEHRQAGGAEEEIRGRSGAVGLRPQHGDEVHRNDGDGDQQSDGEDRSDGLEPVRHDRVRLARHRRHREDEAGGPERVDG